MPKSNPPLPGRVKGEERVMETRREERVGNMNAGWKRRETADG